MDLSQLAAAIASPVSLPVRDDECREVAHEIWGLVISHPDLSNKDLKKIRLVSTAFRDLATPRLFDHIAVSLMPENLDSFKKIASRPYLATLVRTVHFDNTSFEEFESDSDYCAAASHYYSTFLEHQSHGPLSKQNLHVAVSFGPKALDDYLDGYPRLEFQQALFRHKTNSMSLAAKISSANIFVTLKDGLSRLTNLATVKVHQAWSLNSEMSFHQSRVMFRAYLARILPLESLKLIPGAVVKNEDVAVVIVPNNLSLFDGPGIAARNMHPLSVPPTRATGTSTPFQQFLLALNSTTPRLRELYLPGSIPEHHRPRDEEADDKCGYMRPNFCFSWSDSDARRSDDDLVPTFSKLQKLRLRLDPSCSVPSWSRTGSDLPVYFSKGIQAMRQVKELDVGFHHVMGDHFSDYVNDWNSDSSSARYSLATVFLLGLAAAINDSESDDERLEVEGESEKSHNIGPTYPSALSDNLWPNLRMLTLTDIKATFSDLCVLFKTVAPSLRILKFVHIVLLGSCQKCRARKTRRSCHFGSGNCPDYVDVAVMLANVLNLDSCAMLLHEGDFGTVVERMNWPMTDFSGDVLQDEFMYMQHDIANIGGVPMDIVKAVVDVALETWLLGKEGTETHELMALLGKRITESRESIARLDKAMAMWAT